MNSISESDCISNELKGGNHVPVGVITSDLSSENPIYLLFVEPSEDGDGQDTINIEPSEDGDGQDTINMEPSEDGDGQDTVNMEPSEDCDGQDTINMESSEDGDGQDTISTLEGSDKATEADNKKKSSRKSKKGTEIFKCNKCNYSNTKRYMLARHEVSHSDERRFKCSVCERGFKTKSALKYHINTHTDSRPYPCPSCDSKFKTPQQLISHKRYKHSNNKRHKCTECPYASIELCKLRRHMKCHSGYRPHQCPHCSYSTSEIFNLRRHIRSHKGIKAFECLTCHARFGQSNSLKIHRMVQHPTEEKQVGILQCDKCNSTFKQERYLRVHMRRFHTALEPVACKTCGHFFPDKYTCQMHSKTHQGEKCNKCCFCSYACKLPNHLKRHMRTHTGEKPYTCDYCNQSFSQKGRLKSHIFTYHIPNDVPPKHLKETFNCAHCSQTFRHKGILRRHMRDHGFQLPKTASALEGNQLNKNQGIHYQQKEAVITNNEQSFPGEMLEIGSFGIISFQDSSRGLEATVTGEDNADPDSLPDVVLDGTKLQELRKKSTEWNVENYFGFDEESVTNEITQTEEQRELQNTPDGVPLQDGERLEINAVMTSEDGIEPQTGEIPLQDGDGLGTNAVMTGEDGVEPSTGEIPFQDGEGLGTNAVMTGEDGVEPHARETEILLFQNGADPESSLAEVFDDSQLENIKNESMELFPYVDSFPSEITERHGNQNVLEMNHGSEGVGEVSAEVTGNDGDNHCAEKVVVASSSNSVGGNSLLEEIFVEVQDLNNKPTLINLNNFFSFDDDEFNTLENQN